VYPPSRPQFPPVFELGGDVALHAAGPYDAEAVYAVVDANREHLRIWLPWVDASRDVGAMRAFLTEEAAQRERGATATYLIRESGSIAGVIDLHGIDAVNSSFFVGYWLAKGFEGCGLITRACECLLSAAFNECGMERAVIRCAVGNARSAAVPKRLGFQFEGVERHGQRLNGRFVDLKIYSRLRGDS
jgi:ribosomal-protein-serine acetyltransferase